MKNPLTHPGFRLAASLLVVTPTVSGQLAVDGLKDFDYGNALSLQTIQTGFGDNKSEWNAAYAAIIEDRLFLMFTGNLENNFNKVSIFIDTHPGGSSTFPALPGNDGSGAMAGMRFDEGFTPEYHFILRRGGSQFDLDFAELGTARFSSFTRVLGNTTTGSNLSPTGPANEKTIGIAYDDSNTAGIGESAGAAANQDAARAVDTGLELSVALSDLGAPPGELRVMLLQNNQSHDYLSNQSLGGLPIGTQNLQNPASIDFNNFAGDQFFTVTPPATGGPELSLNIPGYNRATGELTLTIGNIPEGQTFHLRRSSDGSTFTPVGAGLDFDSTTPQPIRVPVTGRTLLIQAFAGSTP